MILVVCDVLDSLRASWGLWICEDKRLWEYRGKNENLPKRAWKKALEELNLKKWVISIMKEVV